MLTVTSKALEEIKRLQKNEDSPETSYLRVMVVGGGCSGLSYKLGFDTQPPVEKDKVIEKGELRIIIDPKSFLFLDATELDYTDGLNGRGFVFNNAKAKKICGCGNSFSA